MKSSAVSLSSLGLQLKGLDLTILDQRLLPGEECWVLVRSPEHLRQLIQGLAVRGAPLIGVSAALGLAVYAGTAQRSKNEILQAAHLLREARPTAVNLMLAIDRLLKENPDLIADGLMGSAIRIFEEEVKMTRELSEFGSELIHSGDGVLTICNTGGLATVGSGSALGVIAKAHQQGKKLHVYFCETRPLLQGARLTAWELEKLGIPHTLICDSMAADILRSGKIKICIVGADRIAANGDFANKIGTYSLAALCRFHGVPFYTAAPESTIDRFCSSGKLIPIEERNPAEVRGFQDLTWAPAQCPVYNPSFDMSPAELLSGIILNTGVYTPQQFKDRNLGG